MLQAVKVTNYLGESIRIELAHPETSGFVIFDITGLGPPKANINVTDVANVDGGFFNSSRATPRNIVFKIKLLGQPSVEETRHRLYKYFPLQKWINLEFETDIRTTHTTGYVETNEPVIFSSQQYTQISVVCPPAYMQSILSKTITFSGIEAAFEFPFSNESLTEPLLILGDINMTTTKSIFYDGDVEVGIVINIHATGAVKNITIHNLDTRESINLNISLVFGDDVIITTTPGEKSIRLFRDGEYTNILNAAVSSNRMPDWFKLRKGYNTFTYLAEEGVLNLEFSVKHLINYEGV